MFKFKFSHTDGEPLTQRTDVAPGHVHHGGTLSKITQAWLVFVQCGFGLGFHMHTRASSPVVTTAPPSEETSMETSAPVWALIFFMILTSTRSNRSKSPSAEPKKIDRPSQAKHLKHDKKTAVNIESMKSNVSIASCTGNHVQRRWFAPAFAVERHLPEIPGSIHLDQLWLA